jgi:hypothetical protein
MHPLSSVDKQILGNPRYCALSFPEAARDVVDDERRLRCTVYLAGIISSIDALEIPQDSSDLRAQLMLLRSISAYSQEHLSILLRALPQTEDVKGNER